MGTVPSVYPISTQVVFDHSSSVRPMASRPSCYKKPITRGSMRGEIRQFSIMTTRSRKQPDTVRIPFAIINTTNSASGLKSIPVTPLMTPRLTILADTFDEYRFVDLKFRILPIGSLNTDIETACFEPGVVDTPPGNNVQQSESLASVYMGGGESVRSPWCNVPKGVLSGYFPWYKTVAGTTDTAEEVQGNIFTFNSLADTTPVVLEIRGVCEFRAAINATSTPAERVQIARRKEKERIVSILAMPDCGPATVKKSAERPRQ